MGKKKSKVSKQKQTMAKQRCGKKIGCGKSTLGGVSISKGFSSKSQQSRQQTQQQTSVILHVHNGAQKNLNNNSNSTLNRKELMQKLSQTRNTPKVFLSPSSRRSPSSCVALQPRLGSIQEDSEQQDFDRQMASLHERQWVEQHKFGKKRGKKGTQNNDKAAMFSSMQPASFSVEKTPEDLLHETMHKMVQMTGVGISAAEKTPIRSNKTVEPNFCDGLPTVNSVMVTNSVATTRNEELSMNTSSLAAALHKQQNEQREFIQQNSSNNPFAALGNDNSDEDDDGTSNSLSSKDWSLKIQSPPSNFQFAPFSFSLMPRETPTPASTPIPSHRMQRQGTIPSVQACSLVAAPAAVSDSGSILDQDYDPDL